MSKYKVGLVVGRFQPFHKGHLYLLKKAFKYADKVVVAIGSSNMKNADNPLSFSVRTRMIKKVIKEEKFEHKIVKIVASPDHPSDNTWLERLSKNAGAFDVVIGNNDWVNGILKNAGFPVLEIPYYKRSLYQGIFVRKLFARGEKWESRVPPYLIESIKKELSRNTS